MSIARLRGKGGIETEGHVRLEDLLVSDVLGALRYLPADVLAGPLVREAVGAGGSFAAWLAERGVDPDGSELLADFWPTLEGKEPDLLLRFFLPGAQPDSTPVLAVLVEAKLHASQHPIKQPDGTWACQVAHYHAGHDRWAWDPGRYPGPATHRATIYLTASPREPAGETAAIRGDAERLLGAPPSVFWLSWFSVADVASRRWRALGHRASERPWLRHLADVVAHLRLRDLATEVYTGLPAPPPDLGPTYKSGGPGALVVPKPGVLYTRP